MFRKCTSTPFYSEFAAGAGNVGRVSGLRRRRPVISGRWLSIPVVAAVLSGQVASGGVIVAYDAANSPTTAPAAEVLGGVTPLDLSRGPGVSAGSGATFNTIGWTDEATDYLEWGWSSSSPLQLTDLDLRYDRSASGPSMLEILLSVNGGAFNSIFLDNSVSESGEEALDIDLSSFSNVTSATFRLLGSGASSSTGTFDIEPLTGISPDRGIVVNGVAAVPEPGAIALFGVGGLMLLSRLRRRR